MPHVNIKHFPVALDEEQQARLVATVSDAIGRAFGVEDRVISIALEPVEPALWHEQVYGPEIEQRRELVCKMPQY